LQHSVLEPGVDSFYVDARWQWYYPREGTEVPCPDVVVVATFFVLQLLLAVQNQPITRDFDAEVLVVKTRKLRHDYNFIAVVVEVDQRPGAGCRYTLVSPPVQASSIES
jgi:hypothetical protein